MIATILLLGVVAGLDNLQVCSSVGLLAVARKRLHLLAAAFSLCELAAPLAGLVVGQLALAVLSPFSAKAAPVLMLACGAVVLVRALRPEGVETGEAETRLLFGLPLSLSLDNVMVGAGLSAGPHPALVSALGVGAISAGMSILGLYFGAWLRRLVPARVELMAGAWLCLLGVRMLMSGGI